MKNRIVTEDNWEVYQKKLQGLYKKTPVKYQKVVTEIVELELELENISTG